MIMEIIIDNILPRLESLGYISYWIIFLVGTIESLPFIGMLVPGGFILIGSGFLASEGTLHLGDLIWASTFGSVIGDSIGYYLGRYRGRSLFASKNKLFDRFFNPQYIEKVDKYFSNHGGKSIFLGRFVGFLRPFVAFVAGMHHMPYGKFLFFNITSGLLWSVSYILIGFFFAEQTKKILMWMDRTTYGIVIFVVIIGIGIYLWKRYRRVKI